MEIQHCRICEGKEIECPVSVLPEIPDTREIICYHCGNFFTKERDLVMTPKWNLMPTEIEKVVEFIKGKNKIGEKPLLEKNAGFVCSGEEEIVSTRYA